MLNQCVFNGRLTEDPKLFGGDVCHVCFTLAVDGDYEKDGERAKADFLDFIAWGPLAEHINNKMREGDLVSVVSSARVRVYETRGEKRRKIEFRVEKIDRLRRAGAAENVNS